LNDCLSGASRERFSGDCFSGYWVTQIIGESSPRLAVQANAPSSPCKGGFSRVGRSVTLAGNVDPLFHAICKCRIFAATGSESQSSAWGAAPAPWRQGAGEDALKKRPEMSSLAADMNFQWLRTKARNRVRCMGLISLRVCLYCLRQRASTGRPPRYLVFSAGKPAKVQRIEKCCHT
jgi:hypothetical protein